MGSNQHDDAEHSQLVWVITTLEASPSQFLGIIARSTRSVQNFKI